MRLIRWTTGIARSLRGLVTRVHRRTEPLPRLPFGIAVGVAALLLLMVIETGSAPDAAVTEVDELSLEENYESFSYEYETVPAELEIVEFGFGAVVDRHGTDRLSLGAVVRNPHDAPIMPSTLTVVSDGEESAPFTVEEVYLDPIPADTSISLGYVLLAEADGIDEKTLDLVVEDAQMWEPPEGEVPEWYAYDTHTYPSMTIDVVDIEPLFSPEGYRITYRIETAEDTDRLESVKVAIVFRDGDGAIIGGMPAWSAQYSGPYDRYRTVPPGVSLQYLDLPEAVIPDRADLNRIEIGPGV